MDRSEYVKAAFAQDEPAATGSGLSRRQAYARYPEVVTQPEVQHVPSPGDSGDRASPWTGPPLQPPYSSFLTSERPVSPQYSFLSPIDRPHGLPPHSPTAMDAHSTFWPSPRTSSWTAVKPISPPSTSPYYNYASSSLHSSLTGRQVPRSPTHLLPNSTFLTSQESWTRDQGMLYIMCQRKI